MKKRFFVIFFSLIFSLTLLVAGDGTVRADSPKVNWNFNDETCSVAINTHTPINYGNVTLEAGEWIYFRDGTSEDGRTVYTESNCTSGYDVYVEAKSYKPNGVNVLEDFQFSTDMVSTRAESAEAIVTDWGTFSETGSSGSVHMGSVSGSDVGNTNFSPGAGNVDGTEWLMDYRYQMDSADTLSGSYQVQLEFTVTSKDSGGSPGGGSEGGGEEDDDDEEDDEEEGEEDDD